jgi:hypothetical protein
MSDISEKFAKFLLAAVKGEAFDVEVVSEAMLEGANLAMLRAKRVRDEETMDRLAALYAKMDLQL